MPRSLYSRANREMPRASMETCQRNELPAVTHFGQIPNESLHLIICHASSIPIERWRIVVCQHEIWASSKHIICKFLGLFHIWFARFHPDSIAEWGKGFCSLCTALGSTFEPVEAFHSTSLLPVKVDLWCTKALRQSFQICEGQIPAF